MPAIVYRSLDRPLKAHEPATPTVGFNAAQACALRHVGTETRRPVYIRLLFAILDAVRGAPQPCRVSFTDSDGLEHSVQVVARTRNEAAVRALAQFRRMNREKQDALNGPYMSDKLTVRIMSEERHEVTVAQAEAWLERHGVPAEMALKHELKGLFPAPSRKS